MFFKCSHPANRLFVDKDHTSEPIDKDFNEITYHLFCRKCGEKVQIKYAEMIGGVDKFLKRGKENG